MLSLEIYLSLHCVVAFLNTQTDGDFTTSLDKLFQASMTLLLKKVLFNISRTELFIKFKTIKTRVTVCIVNRQR